MTSINTTSAFTTKPEAQRLLTMEQIIANAVHTIVVERDTMTFNQRGIEPTLPDEITLKEWTELMALRITKRGHRIRLGQLAASFSLAAGRPILYGSGSGKPRLHAVSSLKRAMEAMGL
jgi:hypothetical protein